MTAKQTQTVERNPDFRVFSGPLAVKHDGVDSDRPMLHCTASSTAIDLEADRFTKSALTQMRDGFLGKVIFLNHSYRVPMDVFGVVAETALVTRDGRLDLDMAIRVETSNPLAAQTYDYVVNGTRLGVSVGVIVTEADKSDDEDDFGKRVVDISGVIPLEASVVGIPCNQTAWTQEAVKSLYERGAIDFDEEEIAARPWLTTAIGLNRDEKEDSMSKDTDVDIDETKEDTEDEDAAEEDTEDTEDVEDSDDSSDSADSSENTDDSGDTEEDSEESEDTADADDSSDDSDSDDSSDDSDDSDDSASDEDSDETKDQEGEDEEGGGDDEHDANDGDGEHKEDAGEPDETKGEFEDDIAADEAADLLIDKMYTGFYVALRNLVGIVLDTDMNEGERAKAGAEVIEAWKGYIDGSWDDTIDHLDTDKDVSVDEDFDVAVRLHDLVAAAESVECEVAEVKEIAAKAAEVAEAAQAHAEENKRLQTEVETLQQGLEYAAQVVEAVQDIPIPTVTTEATQVARNLAEKFPNLDTRVVERIARFAPKRRNR